MANLSKSRLFSSPRLDSRVRSANTTNAERWLGYFFGPALAMTMFYISGQSYLNQFYTDVLGLTAVGGGLFLTFLPIVSKILDAVTNIIMGRIIDNTRTRQGKARPWLLISGPLIALGAIGLFAVPRVSMTVQIIWVMISYNFYFCIAFTMYNISHTLMVPLSTRNTRQRDTLAMLSSMGVNMLPGLIVSMLFPALILPLIGVDQGKWITVMAILGVLALPAVMIEYYFTKERVTEENLSVEEATESRPIREQIKACLSSKYWLMIMGIAIIYNLYNNYQVTSTLYYCNWVLGTYNDGVTMTIVNAVGQAPLGFGILLALPLVRKFGKRNVMLGGMFVGILGCVICLLAPRNMGVVLAGLMLKSLGTVPITYTLLAMIADTLDHVEWLNKFRADGFSASVYSIILTVTLGISTGIFNLGLSAAGYVKPLADGSWVAQNAGVQRLFINGLFLIPAIGFLLIGVILLFYKLDHQMAGMKEEITQRHRMEAEARGEKYISPEEKAAMELAESDRIAEENRIAELKARCEKKGLKFEEEEAKYQAKLAEKKAKADARAAKRNRR